MYVYIGATVSHEELMVYGREGEGEVEVCLVITNVPDDGLECDVSVSLSAFDGAKTGIYVCIYCMYDSGHIFCELKIINFKLGLNVPTFFTQQNKSVTSAPIPKEHTCIL